MRTEAMDKQIIELAKKQKTLEVAALLAFIEVETGGHGFAVDGKLIIQFEPTWFKRKAPFAPSGKWTQNGVERQSAEWLAFNDAFKTNTEAAMESTSIGLGQIMGFHWKRLGFISVGEMWDDAKKGLSNQVEQILKFICTDNRLFAAIINLDWHTVASIYNGSKYRELAVKLGREPYDVSMAKAYNKYLIHNT